MRKWSDYRNRLWKQIISSGRMNAGRSLEIQLNKRRVWQSYADGLKKFFRIRPPTPSTATLLMCRMRRRHNIGLNAEARLPDTTNGGPGILKNRRGSIWRKK